MNFQGHSETSRKAYEELSSENTQLNEIYKLIKKSGNDGLTGSQIAKMMNIPIGTVSARIASLTRSSHVIRSNTQRFVNGRFSTIIYSTSALCGKVLPERSSKNSRLKNVVKELLTRRNDDGTLFLSKIDIARLEKFLK